MRIQHNIMAMNSYRNYNNNVGSLSKNLEKLSSGYRINRAGDDAAGLAISEKMRAQITGLDAAQKNVQDGISLVKTAEGAMQEIQDMLNRMKYLAVQSANGTYEDEVDRENLQAEVDALKDEINRIADSANFNGKKLLDGSLSASQTTTLKATADTGNKKSALDLAVTADSYTDKDGNRAELEVAQGTHTKDGTDPKVEIDAATGKITVTLDSKTASTAADIQALFDETLKGTTFTGDNADAIAEAMKSVKFSGTGVTLGDDGSGGFGDITAKATPSEGEPLTLQIGDTGDTYNQLALSVKDMHADALGIGNLSIEDIASAQAAVDTIMDAINMVSSQRGDLGAIQNRLEHTANNLSVMEENIQNAESAIRDTDIADEMMAYTKNNILIQSAQAMLAQSNAVPQGVLQLLQ